MTPHDTTASPMGGQTVNFNYTGTAGTSSAMPSSASGVRLRSTTACFVRISTEGTAAVATTDFPLDALSAEYFPIPEGAIISAIRETADGVLYCTPCA